MDPVSNVKDIISTHTQETDLKEFNQLIRLPQVRKELDVGWAIILLGRNLKHSAKLIQPLIDIYIEQYESKEFKDIDLSKVHDESKNPGMIHKYNKLTPEEGRIYHRIRIGNIISGVERYCSASFKGKGGYVESHPLENCFIMLNTLLSRLNVKFDDIKKKLRGGGRLRNKTTRKQQIEMLVILNFPLTVYKDLPDKIDYIFTDKELLKIYSLNHKTLDKDKLNKIFNVDFNRIVEKVFNQRIRQTSQRNYYTIFLTREIRCL